jgi:hypothetical protein
MVKRVKQIKAKKVRLPRQPRQRKAAVPRKPPITNVSVIFTGGSNQPSGSYYFPDANQVVQPLASNVFTPTQPTRMPVYKPIEEPSLMPFDLIPEPSNEFKPLNLVSLGKKESNNSFFSSPFEAPIDAPVEAAVSSARGRGRPKSEFSTTNKKLPELQGVAELLGVNYEGLNRTKLLKEITYAKQKQQKSY